MEGFYSTINGFQTLSGSRGVSRLTMINLESETMTVPQNLPGYENLEGLLVELIQSDILHNRQNQFHLLVKFDILFSAAKDINYFFFHQFTRPSS